MAGSSRDMKPHALLSYPVILCSVSQPPVRGPAPVRGKFFLQIRKTFTTKSLFFLKIVGKR
jgi:hypothetical protein